MCNIISGKMPAAFGVWHKETEEDLKYGVSPVLSSVLLDGDPKKTMPNGDSTVWAATSKAFVQHAVRPCLGYRELLKREFKESSNGKKFEKLTLANEFTKWSYKQVGERVQNVASNLVKEAGLKKGDRVLIFAETQADWMVTMLACSRQGATVVTAYATLGEEGVTTSLNQSKAAICVCDAKLFPVIAESQKKCPGLKFVAPILTKADEMTPASMQAAFGDSVKVKSFAELAAKTDPVDPSPADPKDLAVLMYTSGTTGASKGVMISNENLISCIASARKQLTFIGPTSVYLAYLPLAHIMELAVEVTMLTAGAEMDYGNAQTLTDTGLKLATGCRGDAPISAPTLIVFAPAVLDKIYATITDRMAKTTGCGKTLFTSAMSSGLARYDAGAMGANCCLNALVMKRIQGLLGGRLTEAITGSAPLSAEIQKFAQTCFNCPIRQGYGLTETCGASCIADMSDNTPSQVGAPTPNTYVRLRDWPEGNYKNSDAKDPKIGMRRGEVLIGGPMVAMGYLVDEANPDMEVAKKNEEDFVTIGGERYFCSGDVGQVTKNGCLMIIDRKKDLFKGASGEYVSLSKVEAFVKLGSVVDVCMVYGQTGAKNVIVLVCPKKHAIEDLGKEVGASGDFQALCKNKDVIAAASKNIMAECKKGGLAGFEMPGAIAFCCTSTGEPAWTPDNDMLTTTMKLKRPIIARTFAAEVEEAYSRA